MTSFLIIAAVLGLILANIRTAKKSKEWRQEEGLSLDRREITRIMLDTLQWFVPTTEQLSQVPEPRPRQGSKSQIKRQRKKRSQTESTKRSTRTTHQPAVVSRDNQTARKTTKRPTTKPRARNLQTSKKVFKTYDKYVVVDFETTGTNWPYYAVEAAWIEVDESLNELFSMESLIKPPVPIPEETTAIHGISDEDVADKPTADEFFTEIDGDRFSSLNVCVIGHNVFFDLRLFEPFCGSSQPLCTCSASRLRFPELYNHKLQTVASHLGLGKKQSHRAMSDARLSLEVLRSLSVDLQMSIPELVEFTLTPPENCAMPWGKHRGKPVDKLSTSYLKWLLPKTNPDYLRVAVQRELAIRNAS